MMNNRISTYLPNTLIAVMLVWCGFSLLNLPVIATLWRHSFDDGTYSHAYLIPVISLYLYYYLAKNGQLSFSQRFSPIITIAFIGSAIALILLANAQISLGYWTAFLTTLTLAMAMIFGFSWPALFPTGLLIFILPLWGGLSIPLQDLSVVAVSYMMGFTGIPTFVDAPFVTIPSGTFEIADGCSGLRYFIVSLAISVLYCFLYIKSSKRSAFFIACAIFGALLTNWIRITILIVIGHQTEMTSPLMEDHNTFGWYVFMPFMILLFLLGNKIADYERLNSKSEQAANQHITLSHALPVIIVCVVSATQLPVLFKNQQPLAAINTNIPLPTIFFAEQQKVIFQNEQAQQIHLSYTFNGADLDAKPSYYLNEIIPAKWKIVTSEKMGVWQVYHVITQGKQAIISVSYQMANFQTASLGKLKWQRLKQAYVLTQTTQLHWQFNRCNSNCLAEKLTIQ